VGASAYALALARMNEDYIDQSLLGAIIVSCVNEYDVTRFRPKAPNTQVNPWLRSICEAITLPKLEKIEETARANALASVNPVISAVQLTAAPNAKQGTATSAGTASDAMIKLVQQALLDQQKKGCAGCYPGAVDGVPGPKTTSAVYAYQVFKGLPPNGNPEDPKTMESLGVTQPAATAPQPGVTPPAAAAPPPSVTPPAAAGPPKGKGGGGSAPGHGI
jgi:peptidoglycan hydrolase-like protein with peptidoglycan-binding domain